MGRENTDMDLTLDYHAHILPGCDHGSDGLATSLKQLQKAKKAGIQTIIATPHFYPHKERIGSFLARRQQTCELLMQNRLPGMPEVYLGAEVLICEGMEKMEGLGALCRQGTRELLLEMPFYKWPESIWDTLYGLLDREDIQVVIAHADRYPPEDIQVLIKEGVPLQLNAVCLTKLLRRGRYLNWIQKGYVQYLGSDIHMLGQEYDQYETGRKAIKRVLRT